MHRAGQNHVYTMHTRFFRQGFHEIYGRSVIHRVGQNHVHTVCIHGIFGRDSMKFTVGHT